MPSSGSFVTMYLAELQFGNGYMEIGLLISSLHGNKIKVYLCLFYSCYDANQNSRGRESYLIMTSSSVESDRLGSAAIEFLINALFWKFV